MKFSLDTTVAQIPGVLENFKRKYPDASMEEALQRFGVSTMTIATLIHRINALVVGNCALAHETSGDLYAKCPHRNGNAACGHSLLGKNIPSAASIVVNLGAAICEHVTSSNTLGAEVLQHAIALDEVDTRAMRNAEFSRAMLNEEPFASPMQPMFEAQRKEIGVRVLKTNAEIAQRLQQLFGGQHS